MHQAEIRITYSSSSLAKSVKNALTPDDQMPAEGMKLSTQVRGRTLRVQVKGAERLETLQATVQDIFRCIHAAETSLAKVGAGHLWKNPVVNDLNKARKVRC